MNILCFNQCWFKEEWEEDGDKVYTVGFGDHFDYHLDEITHINSVLKKLPQSFGTPDVIVCFDNSSPIYVFGLEDINIPTFFYAVDTHQHLELHTYLSNCFDHMTIAMKDYLSHIHENGCKDVDWLPLWASKVVDASDEKKYGAVFVGTLNKDLNPGRVAFFEKLCKETDVLCKQGAWWEIFPYSEIVINQTVKGDLNFRVFEAMGTGALLLTEKTPNGLFDIFEDKKHLVTYTKDDVKEAKEIIEYYLSHTDEARQIARAGREEIFKHHLPRHRADWIKAKFNNLPKRNSNRKYISMAFNFFHLFLSCQKLKNDMGLLFLQIAMNYVRKSKDANEIYNDDDLFLLLKVCVNTDFIFKNSENTKILYDFNIDRLTQNAKTYDAWKFINQGNVEEAKKILGIQGTNQQSQVFDCINNFVCSLIEI